jgi:hypothetical protein
MVPGVQCAILILGGSGIQWLLALYVSNLDSQNMVFQNNSESVHVRINDLDVLYVL